MMQLSLARIATAVGGAMCGADVTCQGASTDTRSLQPGNLFVALKGPHFDAHDFLIEAKARGAAAALVQSHQPIDLPQVVVDDTRLALGRLAAAWRQQLNPALVAVTGSNGKTTVKEMLASILAGQGPVLATRGNLNNDIGVPLTLLQLSPSDRYAVIEMGANAPGEIAYLTGLARPAVALVNNTGRAHLGGFGGREGVICAKGEIYAGLGESGIAIINADDMGAEYFYGLNCDRRVIDFGLQAQARVRGRILAEGVEMATEQGTVRVRLRLLGRHNAANALAATAAALALDVPLEAVVAGLEAMQPVPGRMQPLAGHKGSRIIDDTYNANPDSLRAALEVLQATLGEHWLVLGDMGELGADAEALHAQAGEMARAAGVTRVFTFGALARHAAEAFGAGAEHFQDQQQLMQSLQEHVHAGVQVLVKGSRSAHMENIVRALASAASGDDRGAHHAA